MESDSLRQVFTFERLQARNGPRRQRSLAPAGLDDERVPELKLRIERRGRVTVLTAEGQLLEETCAALRDCLPEILTLPCEVVAVTMHQLTEIDSAGLGLLIHLQKLLADTGRRLVLVACSPQVRRALQVTRLEVLLPQVSSLRQVDRA